MPSHPSNHPPHLARWLLPSLTHWVWLLIFATLLTGPWRTALVSADGDPCWHWRLGEEMLATGRIVDTDTLSHTRYGAPFLTKEWLSEVLLAVGGAFGGLTGVAVVGALIIATTFGLLHRQLLREGNDVLTTTLVILLAAWASTTHWIARPHLFSLLFTVLWHGELRRYLASVNGPVGAAVPSRPLSRFLGRLGTAAPTRLAISLAVLTVFWVNLHGGFLVGFILLGIYWTGALIDTVRDWLDSKRLGSAGASPSTSAPSVGRC
ncbi:hypothetical protein HQ590_12080, partial [bacterium]|nr:hypothetical protein [bacterium]